MLLSGAFGVSITAGMVGGISRLDAVARPQVPTPDPDARYRQRASLPDAIEAAAIWSARLAADPTDFESAWKASRAHYWLGTLGRPQHERKAALEQGVTAARTAAALRPERPEGHFWMAANMGALAESFGLRQGIRYRAPIREALERVLALDPAFQHGSADRALGRWYLQVPGLFGGDKRKSEVHLRTALAYNEQSIITRLFLAETLDALGRRAEALEQLRAAIAAPLDPEWEPEDRHFKQQAEALLKKLTK